MVVFIEMELVVPAMKYYHHVMMTQVNYNSADFDPTLEAALHRFI